MEILKKIFVGLMSFAVLVFITNLVNENNYALSNIDETRFTDDVPNFDPLEMIVSLALSYYDTDYTTHSFDISKSNSPEFISASITTGNTVLTDFYPKAGEFTYRNGFKFKNSYTQTYRVIPDKYIPDFIYKGDVKFSTYGRCGGMAFAALDYFYAHKPIPGYTTLPPNDNPLSKYILDRLYDSLNLSVVGIVKALGSIALSGSPFGSVSNMEEVPRFIYLTIAPTENKGTIFGKCTVGCLPGVRPLTTSEVSKATRSLDQGKPIVLGLIATSGNLGDNHQVVAYGYKYDTAYKYYTFYIWDNNYPGKEIKANWYPTTAGPHGKLYPWFEQFDKQKGFVKVSLPPWRGFFVEDYTRQVPPDMVIDIDFDGVEDSKDNCPERANPDQKNTNGDEYGDACQMGDQDNDGVLDFKDNCRWAANPDQKDDDNNGVGDACANIIL